ncbi:uncharacterized protein Dvir_GJ25679, isoform A [Drosophila virilis]|uniref:Uncharacterized protein, isoform A n=1 Tax=Drosophila virilis TaxID=7244 RepID=A0A0Q9WE21_DROVI|nr:uncharacterized protein LOC26530449 isoform X2 [Drosophila virilis]KRF78544.1 uncharacterized protein Dvir_GJ25679, isoform A [Drosophila virilis]
MNFSNIDFEFKEGSRAGCSLLLFTINEQQIYVKNKLLKQGDTTYVCRVAGCQARVYLSADKSRVYSKLENMLHNHGPQGHEMDKISALSEIKKNLQNNKNTGLKKLFTYVLAEKTKGERQIKLNYDTVKRTLQRKRQVFLPISPTSPQAVRLAYEKANVMCTYGMTKGNTPKQFFKNVYLSSSFAYCIFSSDEIIALMQSHIPEHNRHFLTDATFKVRPLGDFKEFLIIYIKYMQKMTQKTELCYQHLFTYIESNICSLNGASFICDYENAMRNPLKKLHPNMNYYASWFHFTQACRENANKSTGLENMLKSNKQLLLMFMKFLHLPLLPENRIVGGFNLLQCQANALYTDLFSPFLVYFEKQWLQEVGPKNISVFKRSTRTTGSVKAYNLKLGNKLRAKGNFFKFVQCLIDAEYEKGREFALLFQKGVIGNQPSTQQLHDRSQKIMDAMILFEMGKIDIQGFLSRTVSINERFSRQDLDDESNISESSSEMKSSTTSLSTNVSNLRQMSDIIQMNPCIVCLRNPKTVLLRPCNHLNICGTCWDQLVAYNKLSNDSMKLNENTKPKCPACKEEIEEVNTVTTWQKGG